MKIVFLVKYYNSFSELNDTILKIKKNKFYEHAFKEIFIKKYTIVCYEKNN